MQKRKFDPAALFGSFINYGFGVFFAAVIVLSSFFTMDYISDYTDNAPVITVVLVFCAFVGCIGLELLQVFLRKKVGDNKKIYTRIFIVMCLALFAAQCFFALSFDFEPRNDLKYICKAAENYVTLGVSHLHDGLPERHSHYFAVYPNNHMLLLVVIVLYKIQFSLTGEISNFLPTLINIISLNVSFILMYGCAKLIYPSSKAMICAVRGLLFTPLITYSQFFYTDSMGMPWVTGALYLYLKWRTQVRENRPLKRRILTLCACGLVLGIAFKMKGSAVILIPAIFIDLIFRGKGFKEKLLPVINISAVFFLTSAVIGSFAMSVLHISKADVDRYKFPTVHWIMMSADNKGGYQYKDFKYTKGFDSIEEKKQADVQRLKEKISAQGVKGFGDHLVFKLTNTWRDGTYMVNYYYNYPEIFKNTAFLFTAMLCHFMLLIGMVKSFVEKFGKKEDVLSGNFVVKITLIGVTAFFILWESRCRYLVSFFFMFALL